MKKLTRSMIAAGSLLALVCAAVSAKQGVMPPKKAAAPKSTVTKTVAPASAADSDMLLKSMADELNRSMDRLKLEGHRAPYFLSYFIRDIQSFHTAASFGATTEDDLNRRRLLAAYVRVGDYKIDSSMNNVQPGQEIMGLMRRQSRNGSLPIDDDYVALRHKLWLRTDSSYKDALKDLESNQRYLRDNNVTDRPDSFSKEAAVVYEEAPAKLIVDKELWTERVKKASAVFREFEKVERADVSFGAQAETRRYINNEGFKNRTNDCSYLVSMDAVAQAPDGMILADQEYMPSYAQDEEASNGQIDARVRELGKRLTELAAAPVVEDYRGPVLFEGQAAAQFVHEVLDSRLCAVRSTQSQQTLGGESSERIGAHIAPPFISIIDDPTAKRFKDQDLFGRYVVDDDGVKGQRITLVEKGVLKTLCSSRNPTKQVSKSNGHSRYGNGATSNLFLESTKQLGQAELKQRLIELGKEQGLDEVYIVRKIILNPLDLGPSGFRGMIRAFIPGGNGIFLFPPVLIYKVSVADGKEQLVRGAQFSNVSMRAVRDIDATGDDAGAYPVLRGEDMLSVVTPSLLIREIELEKPERANIKLPILTNPYYDGH